jgi:HAD superfamily hydrolase (TIGR01484 family)
LSSFSTLATDYDGTLAHHGQVDTSTLNALRRWRASGRSLVLVTGRELPELLEVCPNLDLFNLVVAENGALLYHPSDRSETILATPPPPEFAARLIAQGAERVSVGRVVVATWRTHEHTAQTLITEMGLPLQVILNKSAVMVLPEGVNKASGLRVALKHLKMDPSRTAAIGDAENDLALLEMCGLGAAVANALPSLKESAEMVTSAERGAGVAELIRFLLRGTSG